MTKRKLGMSLIVLIVAATTMVSGTYAWFLVGGFAELFDLGFDVVQASGGIEVQGSAGTAYATAADAEADAGATAEWGNYLARSNFNAAELLVKDTGRYDPVTSANGVDFRKVALNSGVFQSLTGEQGPTVGRDYNALTIRIRSDNAETTSATMTVSLTGRDDDADNNAVKAARIAVTYNGNTTVLAVAGDATNAVVADVTGTVSDTNNNSILDSADAGFSGGFVASQAVTELTADAENTHKFTGTLPLADIPANTSSADIIVRVWIEGNDSDCTGEKLSAKNLSFGVEFGAGEDTTG